MKRKREAEKAKTKGRGRRKNVIEREGGGKRVIRWRMKEGVQ